MIRIKSKWILLVLTAMPLSLICAQKCDKSTYSDLIQEGKALMERGKYIDAMEYYNSAKDYCPDSSKIVSKLIGKLIQKVENVKVENEKQKKGAQLLAQAFEQKSKNLTYAARSLEASESIYPQNVLINKSEFFSDTTLAYYTRKVYHSPAILGAVALSADGLRWITGSRDGSALFWDQGRIRIRFPSPPNHEVYALDMTPDARYVVITYRNKNLIGTGKSYLWDLEQPKVPAQVFEERISIIHSVAISDNGQFFITGSNDGKARLYQNGKKDLIRTYDCGSTVKGLSISADARFVFTANDENSAALWTIDGKKIIEIPGRYSAAAMSKDAGYLVTGSAEGEIEVWKKNGCDTCYTQVQKMDVAHSERIFSVALSSDGKYFVTGSMDNTAKLWALGNNRPVQVFTGDGADVYSVDITPDGNHIISSCGDGNAYLWENRRLPVLQTLPASAGPAKKVGMSADAGLLATLEADSLIHIWKRGRNTPETTLQPRSGPISKFAVSDDGRQLLALCSDSILVYYEQLINPHSRTFPVKKVKQLSYNSATNAFIILGQQNSVWQLTDQRLTAIDTISLGPGETILAMSPNGEYFIIQKKAAERLMLDIDLDGSSEGGGKSEIKIVQRNSGKVLRLLSFADEIVSAAISNNGIYWALGFQHGAVQAWDRAKKAPVATSRRHDRSILSISMTPEGKYYISAGQDGKAMLWQTGYSEPLQVYEGHGYAVKEALLTPDGKFAMTLGGNNKVRLWASPNYMLDSIILQLSMKEELQLNIPVPIEEIMKNDNLLMRWYGAEYFEGQYELVSDGKDWGSMKMLLDSFFSRQLVNRFSYGDIKSWIEKMQIKSEVFEEIPEIKRLYSDWQTNLKKYLREKEWVGSRTLEDLIRLRIEEPSPVVAAQLNLKLQDTALLNRENFLLLEQYSDTLKNDFLYKYLRDKLSDTSFLYRLNLRLFLKFHQKYPNPVFDELFYRMMQDSSMFAEYKLESLLDLDTQFNLSRYEAFRKAVKKKRMQERMNRIETLRNEIQELEKVAGAGKGDVSAKQQLAEKYNSLAWELLFLKEGKEAEQWIRKGLAIDPESKYLIGNLPHALLLQGSELARTEYIRLAEKNFGGIGYETYKDAFLGDFKQFKKEEVAIRGMDEMIILLGGSIDNE